MGDIKKLKGVNPECWRLRVGDYRVIFRLDQARATTYVLTVSQRREAYRR